MSILHTGILKHRVIHRYKVELKNGDLIPLNLNILTQMPLDDTEVKGYIKEHTTNIKYTNGESSKDAYTEKIFYITPKINLEY